MYVHKWFTKKQRFVFQAYNFFEPETRRSYGRHLIVATQRHDERKPHHLYSLHFAWLPETMTLALGFSIDNGATFKMGALL